MSCQRYDSRQGFDSGVGRQLVRRLELNSRFVSGRGRSLCSRERICLDAERAPAGMLDASPAPETSCVFGWLFVFHFMQLEKKNSSEAWPASQGGFGGKSGCCGGQESGAQPNCVQTGLRLDAEARCAPSQGRN